MRLRFHLQSELYNKFLIVNDNCIWNHWEFKKILKDKEKDLKRLRFKKKD